MKAKSKVDELKLSAIAVPGDNNYAIVHLPRSMTGKRCWVLNQAAYDDLRNKNKE